MNQAQREQQADDLLAAAEQHQPELLAVAVKLTGSREAGMDLFQQNALNCHDTIQRRGFDEQKGQYRFYLLTSLRNLHRKQARQLRPLPLPAELPESAADGLRPGDGIAHLAEQVWAELRENYPAHERVAFRLLIEGYGCQQIAEMVGLKDRTWVWRRMEKIKASLRETFKQAWEGLEA